MSKNVTLHRKNLYGEVWTEPMSRLAPKYGLSGNGLKKICKKLNIPVPPRGYWARLQHGYKVKKTPLTKLKAGVPETYTLQGNTHKKAEKGSTPEDILSPEALELIEVAQSKTNHVSVPLRLASPHPLIQKIQIELKRVKPDDYGMLRPWRKKILSIRASPESLNRALRITQAILKRFEMLGLQVIIETNDYNRFPMTYLHIFDEKFEIHLRKKA